MTATISSETSAHLREGLDALVGDRILISLDLVAEILDIPSREAVRYRIDRGTLSLGTVQVGSPNSPVLVPVADLYSVLGLEYTPPASR